MKLNLPFGLPMPGGPVDRPAAIPDMPGFGAPMDPDAPPPPPPPFGPAPDCELKAQVRVSDTVAVRAPAEANLSGGTVGERETVGLTMTCQLPCINGFYIEGDHHYTVRDTKICFEGDGINDFLGRGAGVQAVDTAVVTLENTEIETTGVIRPCTFAGDYSTLIVKNCTLKGNGGELPPDTPKVPGPGMKQPPEGLGIGGNCRTHLSVGDSHSYFYDSTIYADGWAALSVDACYGDVYLEATRCHVIVKNSGYASYADHGANVVLNECRVEAPVGVIVAGKCRETLRNCTVRCSDVFAMMHSVMGNTHEIGELTVTGGSISAANECIRIKSQNVYLDIRGAELKSDTGCLIHTRKNEDPFATPVEPGEPVYGVKAALSDMETCGDILHEDSERTFALHLKHARLTGGLTNVILCLDRASRWTADKDSTVFLTGYGPHGVVDALPGVTIRAKSDKLPVGVIALPSGGTLIVEN